MAKAKTMSRSRNQLAASYAPESFFTFEGGTGACISRSTAGEPTSLSEPTKDQIFERINELGRAWFDTAVRARDNNPNKPKVMASQCVDWSMLDVTRTDFQAPGQGRVYLCKPSHMGFTPAPLAFVCRHCSLYRHYESLKALNEQLEVLKTTKCSKREGACDWEQMDVIFVHWSGTWLPPFPGQFQWDGNEQKVVRRDSQCVCGHTEFRLNRKQPGIGDWFYECAKCSKPLSPKWRQNDPETLRQIGPAFTESRRTEVSMQAAPYRASAVYYVKQDLFIDFKDGGLDLLARLRPGREEQLKDFIATRYGLGVAPITDEDVVKACTGREDCQKELLQFQAAVSSIQTTEPVLNMPGLPEPAKEQMQKLLQGNYELRSNIIDGLRKRAILVAKTDFPPALADRLKYRQQLFASKFDPFRLAVEHATLEATRLSVETKVGGKKPYVSFTRLDEDLAPELPADKDKQEKETVESLAKLGIADMGLVREFDLCRFTFGYSRMESGPILSDKRGLDMPVRLNMFPPVLQDGTQKHPIYVVQQGNEAIYVRLKPDIMLQWLQSLACPDMFTLQGDEKIGAGILASSQRMSAFLDKLEQSDQPPIYYYVYSLLHSFSHLLVKHMSEYSGLDLGSLGEYIFPADLAFVVYRNGTTMDLGNLSAMWRNAGTSMLHALLLQKATQCGTGSLCSSRGGACPDCIMVPETSCVASNKLLSRSVLRGVGGRPKFDTRKTPIRGFLDFALDKWAAH